MNTAKKIITTIACVVTALTFTSCVEHKPVNVNVGDDSSLSGSMFGKSVLIEIGDGLWYDATTRIVYWWTGTMGSSYSCTVPSPYYAPNGLPYRYNPETNTFEEISNES